MRENRKFERVRSALRCWCEGENVTVYARIENLSEGGLFLRTSTPLEPGASATLRFGAEEDASEVEAQAMVVWTRSESVSPGMGLEFKRVEPKMLEKLRRIIAREKAKKP